MSTRQARRGRRGIIVLTLAAFALLAIPSAAQAWANGGDHGNGFGTHDWVLSEADRLAAARGYHWLSWSRGAARHRRPGHPAPRHLVSLLRRLGRHVRQRPNS